MAGGCGAGALKVVFALCLFQVAASSLEADADLLDDNSLIDQALQQYKTHRVSGSVDSRTDLLQSLLQVAESVQARMSTSEASHGGWKFGETAAGDFGFFREGEPLGFINRQGQVWGSDPEGYLARGDDTLEDSNTITGESAPIGRWTVGETETGDLGFLNNGQLKAVVRADGELWGSAEQGNFKADVGAVFKSTVPAAKELKPGSSLTLGQWVVGETTLTGELAFYKNDDLEAMLTKSGQWYSSATGFPLAAQGHAERHPGALTHAASTITVDCAVSGWSQFDECSKKCAGGTMSRSRNVMVPSGNGGAECPELSEIRTCNQQGCAQDCSVGAWSDWSDCTKECGGGVQTRFRNVTVYPSTQGRPCAALNEANTCNDALCGAKMCSPISATFSTNGQSDSLVVMAGPHWLLYNSEKEVVSEGPHPMSSNISWFDSLPLPFSTGVDAAVEGPSGSDAYLFAHGLDDEGIFRSQWLLFDTANNQISRGPNNLKSDVFAALPAPFNGTIDAAVNRGRPDSNEAYLFSGPNWMLYDMVAGAVVEGPFEINTEPTLQLPEPFHTGLDAAMSDGPNKAVLFRGDSWVQVDLSTRKLLSGPNLVGIHPRFANLVEPLKICTGYDLKQLGGYYNQLHQIQPLPIGTVEQMSGHGTPGYVDAATPKQVQFNQPQGITLLNGYTYVADTGNHAIRRVNLATGATETIAGGGRPGFQDGVGKEAHFNSPSGIHAVHIESNNPGDLIYVADTANHAIRRIWLPAGDKVAGRGEVRTVAGGGHTKCDECDPAGLEGVTCMSCCRCTEKVMGFRDDRDGAYALFADPTAVAVAYDYNAHSAQGRNEVIYVADRRNSAIRRLVLSPGHSTASVVTIAGGQRTPARLRSFAQDNVRYQWGSGFGLAGFRDGAGGEAMFSSPRDLAIIKQEDTHILLVADPGNNRVARITITMQLVNGPARVTIPVLQISAVNPTHRLDATANSVLQGTEYEWSAAESQWIDPVTKGSSAQLLPSICPMHSMSVPVSFDFTLGGIFKVTAMHLEWGPGGGAKDYQIMFSKIGTDWRGVAIEFGAARRATEDIDLSASSQRLETGYIRVSITALHSHHWSLSSVGLIGELVSDHPAALLPAAAEPPTNQTCTQLEWPTSADTPAVCASARGAVFYNGRTVDGSCIADTVTWHEAFELCYSRGARLCSVDELQANVVKPAGCDRDQQRVWSDSACGCGAAYSQGGTFSASEAAANPRVCSSVEQKHAVVCCADEPVAAEAEEEPARKEVHQLGEDPAAAAAEAVGGVTTRSHVEGGTITIAHRDKQGMLRRFTDGNGSAPVDQKCVFPFMLNGEAFNDCSLDEAHGRRVGDFGWCPTAIQAAGGVINHNSDLGRKTQTAQHSKGGILVVTPTTPWGSCAQPGFLPSGCIMSEWSGWDECSMLCGGGTKSRSRKIVLTEGPEASCPTTNQAQACNVHECGFVNTLAGGFAPGGSRVGLGFRESPLNPKWVQRYPDQAPDLQYRPWAIDVVQQPGKEVIYFAGEPNTRADNLNYLRRIDLQHVSNPAVSAPGCVQVSAHASSAGHLPQSAAECRYFPSGNGSFVAKVAKIQLDAKMVGPVSPGAVGLAAMSANQLVVSSVQNQLGSIDLTENIPCSDWMTADLAAWVVSSDGAPQHSNPLRMQLKSLAGTSAPWTVRVTRVVGTLSQLGLPAPYHTNAVGDDFLWSKQMVCTQADGGRASCCVAKRSSALPAPESCPKPTQPACTARLAIEMADYDYTVKTLMKRLEA